MVRAFSLAVAQLFSPRILGVLGLCAMLGVVCFVGVWFGVDRALELWLDEYGGRSPFAGWLGGLATLVLAWFLFPVVVGVFVAMFLEHIAGVVEREHYAHLPKARGLPLAQGLWIALRFTVVLVFANLLLLVLLLFPPGYAIAWFVVNGWLFGREYFELVAMRRVSPSDADSLRKRHGAECLVIGVALAAMALLPLANVALPILATTVMVHRFHDWHGVDADADRDHSLGG